MKSFYRRDKTPYPAAPPAQPWHPGKLPITGMASIHLSDIENRFQVTTIYPR